MAYSSSLQETYSPSNSEEEPLDIDKQKDDQEENKKDGSKSKNKRKKAGRKPRWSQELLNDFIDIIVSSDHYKTKLIFRNTKFQQNGEIYGKIREELKQRCVARDESFCFTVEQLRSKFKKCVSECKRAALTIKTGTGIKRFQEDKNFGAWFQKLYDIVKTRDSCQPEQAREPSATQFCQNVTSTPTLDSSESETSSVDQSQNMFVPVKQPKRKSNRDDPICEAMKLMKTIAEKDPTKELISFMKDDIEKAREHELKLMQMMLSFQNQQPLQGQSPVSAAGHVGFASRACNSDGLYLPYPPAPHQIIQSAGSMYQGPSNYQFGPLSPANSLPTPVNSNYSTPSPESVGEVSTLTRADSPVYHSM